VIFQHTATLAIPPQTGGEQVVALYCTILFMWWYTVELRLDGL